MHVWTRLRAPAEADRFGEAGPGAPAEGARSGEVTVHALPDAFGGASRDRLERAFRETPGVVLLQYVPSVMGLRGANLPFCFWFARVARALPDARVMVHEPYFYFTWSRPWAPGNGLAIAQRMMTRVLVRSALRISRPTRGGAFCECRSSRVARDVADSVERRPRPPLIDEAVSRADGGRWYAARRRHFGTYGSHVANELRGILPHYARAARCPIAPSATAALRLNDLARAADARARAVATGRLDAASTAAALRACDVLLQPYPDGITTRRTSAMAGLANGVATVTSSGALTEPVWADTGAAALVPAGDAAAFAAAADGLLRDASARDALGRRGAAVYAARFSMAHTIAILRGATAS